MLRSIRAVAATTTFLAVCHGVSLRPPINTSEHDAVCISILVYEEPAWVDFLIANALKFTRHGTKLVLHLNNHTTYDEADVKRWQTARTAVSDKRMNVRPFFGSVLWAHLLNAETMAKTWGDTCKYFVIQASNMMWVRPGMEEQVRTRRFSPLGTGSASRRVYEQEGQWLRRWLSRWFGRWFSWWLGDSGGHKGVWRGDGAGINGWIGGGCAYTGNPDWVNFSERLVAPHNVYGHGQPEGSFFPLEDVLRFKGMLDTYIAQYLRGDELSIAYAHCYFENTWLQTYMLNFAQLPAIETYEASDMWPLSYNAINNKLGKQNDSCPMDKVQAVQARAEGYEGFYAVKRVNKDMTHPVTTLIYSMSY